MKIAEHRCCGLWSEKFPSHYHILHAAGNELNELFQWTFLLFSNELWALFQYLSTLCAALTTGNRPVAAEKSINTS